MDHVADAGLLGGDHGRMTGSFAMAALGGGSGEFLLDAAPQILNATIEARFTAVVGALPAH